MPASATPIPAELAGALPEWLTGVAVPIGSALLAAAIVFVGLVLDGRRREQERRAAFVRELSQLLIDSAHNASRNPSVDDRWDEAMISNIRRVTAVGQMKPEEHVIYIYASRIASKIIAGDSETPNADAGAAISHLLSWLVGDRTTDSFKETATDQV